jgi:hypothetical protein
MHDFAQNNVCVLAARIRIESHGLQNAVRAFALGLHRRTAVESPKGQIGKCGKIVKRLDLSFAAKFRDWFLAVKTDVFQFILCHGSPVDQI